MPLQFVVGEIVPKIRTILARFRAVFSFAGEHCTENRRFSPPWPSGVCGIEEMMTEQSN
jgi:hypothetical protein